jgi:hypothetical protein
MTGSCNIPGSGCWRSLVTVEKFPHRDTQRRFWRLEHFCPRILHSCGGLPSRLAFLVGRGTSASTSPCRRDRSRDRRYIPERCVKYRPNRPHDQISVRWLPGARLHTPRTTNVSHRRCLRVTRNAPSVAVETSCVANDATGDHCARAVDELAGIKLRLSRASESFADVSCIPSRNTRVRSLAKAT